VKDITFKLTILKVSLQDFTLHDNMCGQFEGKAIIVKKMFQ